MGAADDHEDKDQRKERDPQGDVGLLVHEIATLSLARGRLGGSGFRRLLSSSGGPRQRSWLPHGRKLEIQTAQQLCIDGDDNGGGAHEDGPHLGRERDAERGEDAGSERYGDEVVAGPQARFWSVLP